MSKTAIIIDSLACIPKEVVERYKIGIVPVIIFFEGKSYRDWIDLTPAQGYEFLERAPQFWKSSAASPEDYLKVYQELSIYADNILVITVSVKLSMFYNSAQVAKGIAKEKLPKLNIEVLDSETVTAAEGFIALAAAKAASEGKPFDEIIAIAKKVKEKVTFLALLDTMRYVHRTGRIPKIVAQIGSTLSIKPILTVSKGVVRRHYKRDI